MIGEFSEVGGRVGLDLVLAWFESYVLHLVFLDTSLESPGQDKHFGILFMPLHVVVREIQMSVETVEEIMADLALFSGLFLLFCSSPGILRQPPFLARKKETFGYLFLSMCALWFFTGIEERKMNFDFFQNSFSWLS